MLKYSAFNSEIEVFITTCEISRVFNGWKDLCEIGYKKC